jgi:predicted transcriptional regulator
MARTAAKKEGKLAAIRLTPAEQKQIDHLASIKQRKPHWIMKEALRQYLEREADVERLRQHTLASWDDFVRAGMHVSEDEMNGWLDTWGTEHEAEPPECHV